MGCDIHLKTYFWSKVENKMVPAMGALEDSHYFPLIVNDRDYDLFGFFGNTVRSWYHESEVLNKGWPDFMKGTTELALFDDIDHHTIRWCELKKLKKGIEDYKARLLDPKLFKEFYDDENDFVQDAVEGKIPIEKYRNAHSSMVASLNDLMNKVVEVEQWCYDYSDVFDTEKIVFVTWMDN